MVLTAEQFAAILGRASGQAERDLLDFMWETGARPQEVPMIEAKHVDLKIGRIVIVASEGKGNRARSIYLTDRSRPIVERLMREHPTGMLFLNSRSEPWLKFKRNSENTGVPRSLLNHESFSIPMPKRSMRIPTAP